MKSAKTKPDDFSWWKHGVIYHIYPRSFYDANQDGIGDLKGIIYKLDYLKELGIKAIWLSPFFKSPQADFGYDVSGYKTVDPVFGTIGDFKKLLKKSHDLGIKVVIDMILNHTSNEHKWFMESKSSLTNPKRDWYIWKKSKKNSPPNNWKSAFGKSAWQYDETTKAYYFHSFFKEQPDLNWRNPVVKKAMFKIIRFWLDLGVDGLRLDVINLIAKDKQFRNNPSFLSQFRNSSKIYTRNRPKSLNLIKSLRKLIDNYDDKMCVGEIYTLPPGDSRLAAKYLGNGKNALHMAFDFSLIFTPWKTKKYKKTLTQMYGVIPKAGWPCQVLSNHDLHRNFSKPVFGKSRIPKAKLKAILLMTLKGTPFIYYGEEIGMENTRIARKFLQDKLGKKFWPFYSGRDKARTPMQWDDSPNAGFSTAKPWLPVNKNFRKINIQNQIQENNSVFNIYKKLILLRNSSVILQKGNWELVKTSNRFILAYRRVYHENEILIILNFSFLRQKVTGITINKLLFSTHKNKKTGTKSIILQPYEGIILGNSL